MNGSNKFSILIWITKFCSIYIHYSFNELFLNATNFLIDMTKYLKESNFFPFVKKFNLYNVISWRELFRLFYCWIRNSIFWSSASRLTHRASFIVCFVKNPLGSNSSNPYLPGTTHGNRRKLRRRLPLTDCKSCRWILFGSRGTCNVGFRSRTNSLDRNRRRAFLSSDFPLLQFFPCMLLFNFISNIITMISDRLSLMDTNVLQCWNCKWFSEI